MTREEAAWNTPYTANSAVQGYFRKAEEHERCTSSL